MLWKYLGFNIQKLERPFWVSSMQKITNAYMWTISVKKITSYLDELLTLWLHNEVRLFKRVLRKMCDDMT